MSGPPRAAQVEKTVSAVKYKGPCVEPTDHEACDLEAQWKAADAARDNTDYALFQLVLAALGTLAVVVTLIFNREALAVARRATEGSDAALAVASRNADAAELAVSNARRIGEAQIRAYLTIQQVTCRVQRGQVYLGFVVENCGQSPALNLAWMASIEDEEMVGNTLTVQLDRAVKYDVFGSPVSPIPANGHSTILSKTVPIKDLQASAIGIQIAVRLRHDSVFGDMVSQTYYGATCADTRCNVPISRADLQELDVVFTEGIDNGRWTGDE